LEGCFQLAALLITGLRLRTDLESELGWLSVSEPSEDVPNLLILRFCSFWEVLRVTGLVLLPGGVSSITGVQETQGSDGEDHGKAESMNMQKMNNKNK